MTLDVSIVIPTYNQKPRFLIEAVESAMQQSYPKNKYEILIVDDGSTRILPESTLEKFRGKEQIRMVKKVHGGISHTLNAGITEMSGRYFKWLSSDDTLCEDALEVFMSRVNSEKEILYGDWIKINAEGRSLGVNYEPIFKTGKEAKLYLWRSFFGNGTASLIPKSAFSKVGLFDCSLPFYEDYDWWLRAMFLHNYSFDHVHKIVAKYRFHQTQLTLNVDAHPIDKALMNWLIKKRVYAAMNETNRLNVNPTPTFALLSKQLLFLEVDVLFTKYASSLTTSDTCANVLSVLRRIIRKRLPYLL